MAKVWKNEPKTGYNQAVNGRKGHKRNTKLVITHNPARVRKDKVTI